MLRHSCPGGCDAEACATPETGAAERCAKGRYHAAQRRLVSRTDLGLIAFLKASPFVPATKPFMLTFTVQMVSPENLRDTCPTGVRNVDRIIRAGLLALFTRQIDQSMNGPVPE